MSSKGCDTRGHSGVYTGSSSYVAPICIVCGEPIQSWQRFGSRPDPTSPLANAHGRVFSHAQEAPCR